MLRDLHARGMNITQISKKKQVMRKTVRKHLDSTSVPEQLKRPKKESKLSTVFLWTRKSRKFADP